MPPNPILFCAHRNGSSKLIHLFSSKKASWKKKEKKKGNSPLAKRKKKIQPRARSLRSPPPPSTRSSRIEGSARRRRSDLAGSRRRGPIDRRSVDCLRRVGDGWRRGRRAQLAEERVLVDRIQEEGRAHGERPPRRRRCRRRQEVLRFHLPRLAAVRTPRLALSVFLFFFFGSITSLGLGDAVGGGEAWDSGVALGLIVRPFRGDTFIWCRFVCNLG